MKGKHEAHSVITCDPGRFLLVRIEEIKEEPDAEWGGEKVKKPASSGLFHIMRDFCVSI